MAEVFLAHQGASIHVSRLQTTSAIELADVEVVRADEPAVAHVDQLRPDGGKMPLRPATGNRRLCGAR